MRSIAATCHKRAGVNAATGIATTSMTAKMIAATITRLLSDKNPFSSAGVKGVHLTDTPLTFPRRWSGAAPC